MDTRNKIISTDEARRVAGGGALAVVALLDPLVAAHARRLEELAAGGRPLLVLIADPEEPLLAARARAELAAGLRAVRWVAVPSASDLEGLAARGGAVDLRDEDRERRSRLVTRIRERVGES